MDYFPPGSPAGEVRGRGPTQVGTTPELSFRAVLLVIGTSVELEIAL
jgi:hypothetical protein